MEQDHSVTIKILNDKIQKLVDMNAKAMAKNKILEERLRHLGRKPQDVLMERNREISQLKAKNEELNKKLFLLTKEAKAA